MRNKWDKYYPLILSAVSLIAAVAFEFPLIPCNLSDKAAKLINYSGSLIFEGACFSFLFFYFVEHRPHQKNIKHAGRIINNKLEHLKLKCPFSLPGHALSVEEFLAFDPKRTFFAQIGIPELPMTPRYIDEWLSNWITSIAQTFREFNEYHQYIDIEFFEELERIKSKELLTLNAHILALRQFKFSDASVKILTLDQILSINDEIQFLSNKLKSK